MEAAKCEAVRATMMDGTDRECGKEAVGRTAMGTAVCIECQDDDGLQIVQYFDGMMSMEDYTRSLQGWTEDDAGYDLCKSGIIGRRIMDAALAVVNCFDGATERSVYLKKPGAQAALAIVALRDEVRSQCPTPGESGNAETCSKTCVVHPWRGACPQCSAVQILTMARVHSVGAVCERCRQAS